MDNDLQLVVIVAVAEVNFHNGGLTGGLGGGLGLGWSVGGSCGLGAGRVAQILEAELGHFDGISVQLKLWSARVSRKIVRVIRVSIVCCGDQGVAVPHGVVL